MASGSSDSILNAGPAKNAAVVDSTLVTPSEATAQQRNPDADYRANFLSSFTPGEEKKIMRKIDYRLLLLCGIIYMVKQVSDIKPYCSKEPHSDIKALPRLMSTMLHLSKCSRLASPRISSFSST